MTGLADPIPSAAHRAARALHTVALRLHSFFAHLGREKGPHDTRVLYHIDLCRCEDDALCVLRCVGVQTKKIGWRDSLTQVPACSGASEYENNAMSANPSGTSSAVGTVLNETKNPRSSRRVTGQ